MCRLSFEDELTLEAAETTVDGMDGMSTFSVGASVSHRFALERTAVVDKVNMNNGVCSCSVCTCGVLLVGIVHQTAPIVRVCSIYITI